MNENQGNLAGDRDDVARLVRLAGKRRAVPRDRVERVRAAAREQWQREVRRRTRKRYVWTAAALAAAASLVLAVTLGIRVVGTGAPAGSGAAIRVEALAGSAWSQIAVDGEASRRRAVEIGDRLHLGSELVTAPEGRAAIRLASGHSVRLDTATKIRLLERGSLALDRGAIYVDSGFDAEATEALDVHTPLGVVQEIGTQFEVRLEDDAMRVRLREGTVVVIHDEQSHEIEVGTELEMSRDGSVIRRALSGYAPAWEWIVGVTPMLDFEGQPVKAFLDWVARERGFRLAFTDAAVARSAGEIVLGGTVEKLTLEQALDAVLPTCRMTYRIEDGVLLISAMPEA